MSGKGLVVQTVSHAPIPFDSTGEQQHPSRSVSYTSSYFSQRNPAASIDSPPRIVVYRSSTARYCVQPIAQASARYRIRTTWQESARSSARNHSCAREPAHPVGQRRANSLERSLVASPVKHRFRECRRRDGRHRAFLKRPTPTDTFCVRVFIRRKPTGERGGN